MDQQKVVAELRQEYPDAPIVLLPPDAPLEIVCEFDSGEKHPEWSLAVAVIDKSQPHYHQRMVEIYRVLRGELILHLNDDQVVMYEGQEYTVIPGTVHWAEGKETWVEVYCTPAYSSEDHLLMQ